MNDTTYQAGTLYYTKVGLVMMFIWLLWGDFCFQIMEAVIPGILPLKLRSLGASNTQIAFMLTMIPAIFNTTICPGVSFYSDRFRSRFGRRIPFLMLATPFITLLLILIGFSDDISNFLYVNIFAKTTVLPVSTITLALITIFIVCFQFFNMFVSSVYFYLFNDVVPDKLLSRFLALFRIVGIGAVTVYHFFIFKHAETHTKEIFYGAALLYFVGFMLICLKVKEGEYPPPPAYIKNKSGLWGGIMTFLVECFSSLHYWYFFLAVACIQMSTSCNIFNIFYYKSLGLSLEQVGRVNGWMCIVGVLLLYPAAVLSDRFHPVRTMLIAVALTVMATALNFIFLFTDFKVSTNYIILIAILFILSPVNTLYAATEIPVYMKLLPKEKYGQYASATAIIRSLGMIMGGFLAGAFMDWLRYVYKDNNFYYRYVPVWSFTFLLFGVIFLLLLYRSWKRYGGQHNYVAPVYKVPIESNQTWQIQ